MENAQRQEHKVLGDVTELRRSLIADQAKSLPEQTGRYAELLSQLDVQEKSLADAAKQEKDAAGDRVMAVRREIESLNKKYHDMVVEQERVGREPVPFAVSEVLKGRMIGNEDEKGHIAPYDNRFGTAKNLEEAAYTMLNHRAQTKTATGEVQQFGEVLARDEVALDGDEKLLNETIKWADDVADRLLSLGRIADLAGKQTEVKGLIATAAGAWIGKERKAEAATKGRNELKEMAASVLKQLESLSSDASARTSKIVELGRRDPRNSEKELRGWLSGRKDFLSSQDYATMEGNIDRYAAYLKRQKEIFDKRQQYHHVTLQKTLEGARQKVEALSKVD